MNARCCRIWAVEKIHPQFPPNTCMIRMWPYVTCSMFYSLSGQIILQNLTTFSVNAQVYREMLHEYIIPTLQKGGLSKRILSKNIYEVWSQNSYCSPNLTVFDADIYRRACEQPMFSKSMAPTPCNFWLKGYLKDGTFDKSVRLEEQYSPPYLEYSCRLSVLSSTKCNFQNRARCRT